MRGNCSSNQAASAPSLGWACFIRAAWRLPASALDVEELADFIERLPWQ
jgi:hypothetical protein